MIPFFLYTGFGWVVFLIIIASGLLSLTIQILVEDFMGKEPPEAVFLCFYTLFPYIGIKVLDRALKQTNEMVRAEEAMGRKLDIPKSHSFLFIPVSWCANAWLAFMLFYSVWELVDGSAKFEEWSKPYREEEPKDESGED